MLDKLKDKVKFIEESNKKLKDIEIYNEKMMTKFQVRMEKRFKDLYNILKPIGLENTSVGFRCKTIRINNDGELYWYRNDSWKEGFEEPGLKEFNKYGNKVYQKFVKKIEKIILRKYKQLKKKFPAMEMEQPKPCFCKECGSSIDTPSELRLIRRKSFLKYSDDSNTWTM